MKQLMLSMMLIPVVGISQEKGIQFEQGLSWQQVQAKAQTENKYIFVDCFATWCVPCKEMDKEVYPDEKLGNYLNERFISVKVQMDTSKLDNEEVQKWYSDGHSIQQRYTINAYPSYLFFSPDGKIVHRALGVKSTDDFITLAANALDPDKQYYTVLENYQQGRKNYNFMPYLAQTAQALGDQTLADKIARDYIDNYLISLKEEELYTKENLEFIISFIQMIESKDKMFNLFYRHGSKVDEVLHRVIAERAVDYIITKEEIDSNLWRDNTPIRKKPNWNKIISKITKKYNSSYAERTVLDAQIRWYDKEKDWPEFVKYNIKKVEKNGFDTTEMGRVYLNDMIYGVIVKYSNDKEAINKGIKWMEIILQANQNANINDAADIDTYANLLFKIGRTKEALDWEEKAAKLEEESAVRDKRVPDKIFHETIDKMKKGEPTWTDK